MSTLTTFIVVATLTVQSQQYGKVAVDISRDFQSQQECTQYVADRMDTARTQHPGPVSLSVLRYCVPRQAAK